MSETTNFEKLELNARHEVSLSNDFCRSYSATDGPEGAVWKDYTMSEEFSQQLEVDSKITFEVSDELADILLAYGFIETTKKIFPEHWGRFQKLSLKTGQYKRAFQFKRLSIYFDHINIRIWYRQRCLGTGKSHQIRKDELKALLILANCSSSLRSKYLKNTLAHPSPESTRLQFKSNLRAYQMERPEKYKRILGDMYLSFDL